MWFGIRISSSFHLGTLQIPIQNIKCPKNAKNADIIILPSVSLFGDIRWPWKSSVGECTVVPPYSRLREERGQSTGQHFGHWLWSKSLAIELQVLIKLDEVWNGWENMMSGHAFSAFLGHLIFRMGMFKMFRWNGLEILIPKHLWKSIIAPLEQIWAKNRYGTFFGTPCIKIHFAKKLGQNSHSSIQQWSEQSTPLYMGSQPPTRWSTQKYKYEWQRSSSWAIN